MVIRYLNKCYISITKWAKVFGLKPGCSKKTLCRHIYNDFSISVMTFCECLIVCSSFDSSETSKITVRKIFVWEVT